MGLLLGRRSSRPLGRHDKYSLDNHNQEHDEESSQADEEDLDIELEESEPVSARESGESVAHREVSLPIDDSRPDSALESRVEGNDSGFLRRQKRGLHSDQGNLAGENENPVGRDRDKPDNKRLPGVVGLVPRHLARGFRVPDLETKQGGGCEREDERTGHGGPVDQHGETGGLEGSAEVGKTTPEGERAGRGHDDMDPGRVELDKSQRTDQVTKPEHHGGARGRKKAVDQTGRNGGSGSGNDSSESASPTADISEETVGGADRGGNRLSVGSWETREALVVGINWSASCLNIVIRGEDFVGRWAWILDHSERGHEGTQRVNDLSKFQKDIFSISNGVQEN